MRKLVCMLAAAVLGMGTLMWPPLSAAQLNVIISGGFSSTYKKLLPEFEKTNSVRVSTGSGASQGTGPKTIGAQLTRGEPFDVVIMSREGLEDLMHEDRIATGTELDLARVGMGVAVRAGAPKPDINSVEAFKRAVLTARSVGASTSGTWLMKDLFPRLGIAEKAQFKITARGYEASDLVAAGDADLGLLPVTEILNVKGIDYAGSFPREIQFMQTFSTAVVKGAKHADLGRRLIAFLASGNAAAVIRENGMEPAR